MANFIIKLLSMLLLCYNILLGESLTEQLLKKQLNGLNKNTWTISPAGSYSYTNDRYAWKITDNKSITETLVTNNITSLRPVINLKATLNITGSGTIDNPYIFSE